MIYHAQCKACRTQWRYLPPSDSPIDLVAAVGVMEKGLCPTCQNDGSKAPINWKFSFGGEPHCGQIRSRKL